MVSCFSIAKSCLSKWIQVSFLPNWSNICPRNSKSKNKIVVFSKSTCRVLFRSFSLQTVDRTIFFMVPVRLIASWQPCCCLFPSCFPQSEMDMATENFGRLPISWSLQACQLPHFLQFAKALASSAADAYSRSLHQFLFRNFAYKLLKTMSNLALLSRRIVPVVHPSWPWRSRGWRITGLSSSTREEEVADVIHLFLRWRGQPLLQKIVVHVTRIVYDRKLLNFYRKPR